MNAPILRNPMDAGTVIAAALIVSALGALFYNILPLFVGVAQDYRGLDNRQVGFLSSAFFLGYNVVTLSAFFWIRRVSWALIVALATPLAALSLYAGTLVEAYAMLMVTTAIAGGAFAALYGVGTTVLGDTSNPARWFGVTIAVEALPGIVLLLVLPGTAVARWGFDGAIIGIIVVVILLSPFLFWIPAHGSKQQEQTGRRAAAAVPQNPYIWAALAATLLFFTAASAMWAFVERVGAQLGFAAESVGVLLSVTLVFAVLGSLLAATLGGRFGNVRPFVAGAAVFLMALYALNVPSGFPPYAVGACLLTGAIGFLLPIAVTEVSELDTDGRYVVLSVPAIGIGAMAGPAIAGALTQGGTFTGLIVFSGAAILFSTLLLVLAAGKARAVTESEYVS